MVGIYRVPDGGAKRANGFHNLGCPVSEMERSVDEFDPPSETCFASPSENLIFCIVSPSETPAFPMSETIFHGGFQKPSESLGGARLELVTQLSQMAVDMRW
jgi:hypothetical protein